FADPARGLALDPDACRTTGMQSGVRGGFGRYGERRSERFEVALQVEEVDRALRRIPLLGQRESRAERADPHRLTVAVALAEEAAPDLEDPYPLLLAVDVGAQRIDEAAEQRAAHHVEVARDRIEHANRVRIDAERAFRLRAHEAERDDLLVVAIDEPLLKQRRRARGFALRKHRLGLDRRCRGNVV